MGLYDSVDRGKPKPKHLTGLIALCCALFLLFGGLTYWACHYQFRFHAFISDLTDSTRDARSTETFRVTVNGSETDVSIDDLGVGEQGHDGLAPVLRPPGQLHCGPDRCAGGDALRRDRLRRRLDA